MAKASFAFTNFTAGELSPRLDGRTDVSKYFNGCKKLQNFVVHPHGGASRRPGTIFVNDQRYHEGLGSYDRNSNPFGVIGGYNTDDDFKIRLIPFEFNAEQTYILEFGQYYFRVHKDGGSVTFGLIVWSSVTGTFEYSSDENSQVGELITGNTSGATALLRKATTHSSLTRTYLVDISGTFQAGETVTGSVSGATAVVTSFSADGGPPVYYGHGFDAAQVQDIKFVQTADVMYLVHPSFSPQQITRTSHQNWDRRLVPLVRGPFLDDNVTNITATASARTGSRVRLTFSADVFASTGGQSNSLQQIRVGENGYLKTLSNNTRYNINNISGTFQVGEKITATKTNNLNNPVYDCNFVGSNFIEGVPEDSTSNTYHNSSFGEIATLTGQTSGATADVIDRHRSLRTVTCEVQENEQGVEELTPSYTASTISFHEGDPSSTNLEHNDRLQDTAGGFLTQGFKVGQKISITGAATSNNNESGAIIVQVTDDTMLLAPSSDLTNEAAGNSVTISGDIEATTVWALGAFSQLCGPSAVAIYEQRLVFAATNFQPQTLFFSKGGDFNDFTAGIDADDGLIYTLGSNQVNVIRYLQPGRNLLVGTAGGEFVVTKSEDAPLSPTNAVINRQAAYGSADIQPVQVGNVTLFVQRAKRKIRELVFDLNSDSYQAPDLTILAEHITESGVKEIAYQQEPDNVVWMVLENGKLIGMTYRREENVIAFHEHVLGGSDAKVESVAVIPGDLDEDEVYIAVKRTIDGNVRRHIERFSGFDFGDDVEDAFFVDCGLTYSGSAATTISGLDHLEGQTVAILANGATHPNKTVSNGSVTLNYPATKAHIGLPFTSTLQTMRLEAGGTEGTSQGKTKRIHDVTLRLFRTVGVKVGSSETELDSIPFRSSANAMDTATPLFSGDKEVEFRGGFDTDGFVVVQQDQPLPLTVLGIFPRLITFDQ